MKLFEHKTSGPIVQNMVSLKPELGGMRVVALSTDVLEKTMGGSEGGQGVRTPLKNHKNIVFHSNTGQDSLKKHNGYQASIQCWAIIGTPEIAFRWRADVGPNIVVFGSSLLSSTKKTLSKVEPPLAKLSRFVHERL